MRGWLQHGVAMSLAVLLLFSSAALAQKSAPPFPRDGAKKLQDNDYFAIWDVTYEKGKSTVMRQLPLDQVSVFLTEGAVKFTKADGTWSIEQEKVGSVRYDSKGTAEAEESLSDNPIRATVFQIKDAVDPHWPVTPGIPDKFPRPGSSTKLFETDRVIVWDYTWKTGFKTALHLHYHPDAAVYIVAGKSRVIPKEGEPHVSDWHVGQTLSGTAPLAAPHQEEQFEGEARAISINLK
jgi:hypothetical protein